ncbi:MAG TPA: hypothetical protein VI729_06095 [Anaerolineales bacterium]|nr:hypothetical protein [Anaerolineales bacterium]
MDPEQRKKLSDAYFGILSSFTLGFLRVFRSKLTFETLSVALTLLHDPDTQLPEAEPPTEALRLLLQIPYAHYDAFAYVTIISHLVYATTLLDTFLSDTTKFLLLLYPAAVGKDHQVPFSTILEAEDRTKIIETAASKRTRELGYLSFPARVGFLKRAFGLPIQLSPGAEAALEHYPTIRNIMIHDQGIFALSLGPDGTPQLEQKTCPLHPTPLDANEVQRAADAYCRIVIALCKAIVSQVFKEETLPQYERAFAALLPARLGLSQTEP